MSVMPRSIFAPDATLLLTSDKASLMHVIEAQTHAQPPEEDQPTNKPRTVIIDSMCIVQAMKKTPLGMTSVLILHAGRRDAKKIMVQDFHH